jgi:hypothetical protein
MKIQRWVKELRAWFDAGRVRRRQEMKSILGVLKKLRAKERSLREKWAATGDADKRGELSGKLDVLRAQRLKGVARLQEIRADLREQGRPQRTRTEVAPRSTTDQERIGSQVRSDLP